MKGTVLHWLSDIIWLSSFVIGKDTTDDEVENAMKGFRDELDKGHQVAFVIRKGALTDAPGVEYKNEFSMTREEIIDHITKVSGADPIISTTGKASRELLR